MAFIKYSKYIADDLEGLDLEDLVSKLADLFLSSGFDNPYGGPGTTDQDLQSLHDAILEALLRGDLLPEETVRRLLGDGSPEAQAALDELIRQIIARLQQNGFISTHQAEPVDTPRGRGERGPNQPPATFEVTDKSLDFLGYRALRDLLGSLGKSSFGSHETHDLSTGIEASGAPRPYEFGDTLNLDANATILSAVRRSGAGVPIMIDYPDLMVNQAEYRSSCATVLLLDCSHSMILYGEDRFTPAKKVALALMNLIRSQYPGDSLHVVLFHDSAEEIPLTRLARVKVGPYYTNTREGLRLARQVLARQRKDMRQIIMITDGKPSAITRPDGRIYKNAFGLDPLIVTETFAEVATCRKAGILINTFMLARDYDLVSFVKRVAAICRGKAYFTTPYTLGQYVLLDYMQKKTRTVH